MTQQLDFSGFNAKKRAISPYIELGAYEALWDRPQMNFKKIASLFARSPGSIPSDFVDHATAKRYADDVHHQLLESGITRYGVRVHGAAEYPKRLRDAEYPVELLYYQGWWELVNAPRSVAIVGARNPSEDGIEQTRELVRALVKDNVTIVSGLAKGIDTAAHSTAIDEGGQTIAVLGTPLSIAYPRENAGLQKEMAEDHLIISQVPVKRYENTTDPTCHRHFFPERNITMSALTDATIIVEAGDTSGTLTQARAALKQNRKLFIMDHCFRNPEIKWPHKFEEQGAIRIREYDEIKSQLLS